MALSCIVMIFLVTGTALAKKKTICAEMMVNTQADLGLCLSTEEEEEEKKEEDGEIWVLAILNMSL